MAVKEKIAYLSDLEGAEVVPSGAVQGNFAVFGTDGALADPGVSPLDFYPKTTTDDKIADALASAEQFVSDQHALASYKASAWSASTEYAENDYCQYGGKGYRCVVAHTSGAGFAPTKWQLVLSVAGKAAIDAVLAPYSSDDKARLLDLCSAYNSSTTYAKGQMVLQDGVLKICTTAGRGAAAVFSSGTVDEAIKQRLAVHADNTNIHVTSEEKTAWNGKQSAISDLNTIRDNASAGAQAAQRDSVVVESADSVKAKKTSDPSVSVDLALKKDVPTKLSQLSNDEDFVKSDAIPTKVSQLENDKGYLTSHQNISQKADQDAIDAPYDTSDGEYAVGDTCTYNGKFYVCKRRVLQDAGWDADDWEETDLVALLKSGKYDKTVSWSDIQNKPNIPDPVVLPFKIVNLLPTGSTAGTTITYTLSDRSINIIEGNNGNALAVAAGKTLRLVPPSSPTSTEEGVVLARDFFVVFNVASDNDVSVSVDGLALRDHAGNSVTVVAPNERRAVYRFTEVARSGSVFLVSMEADPAWLAIHEIDQALDAILVDGGSE